MRAEALTSLGGPGLRIKNDFDGSRRLASLLSSGLMSRDFQFNINVWETQGSAASLIFCGSYAKFRRLLAALREAWFIATGFCPTHLQSKVLKFPFSGSKAWFSMRASPKPMESTARVRMKRRVTPNTAAQALNLLMEVKKGH